MTDSRNGTQSSIRTTDGKAQWELTASTIAYPLLIQSNSRWFEIYVYLKPYSADRLISILNVVPGTYRRNTGDVETFSGDDSKFASLADEAFLKLEGSTSDDPELQKKWLDQNPRQKIRIARDLLGGLEIDTEEATMPAELPADDEKKLELLPLALECRETQTAVLQELWDTERRLKTKVRMTHTLRAETESDWRKWGRTGNERFNKATREWKSNVNWWARLEMYDAMSESISGMCVNGAACTKDNKADWVKLVPAWHKLLIVTSVFDETRVKNA